MNDSANFFAAHAQARKPKVFEAQYSSEFPCEACNHPMLAGDMLVYVDGEPIHDYCQEGDDG